MESLAVENKDQKAELEKQIANLNLKLKFMQEESNFNLQKIKQLNNQEIRNVEEHNLKVHKLKQRTRDLNDVHRNSVLVVNENDLHIKRKKIEALKIVLKNCNFSQLPEKMPPNELELEKQIAYNDMLLHENNELKAAIDKQNNYLISLENKLNNIEAFLKNNSDIINESNRKIGISKLEIEQNLALIESLYEELFDKNNEWAIYKNNIKPIIQKESLFDEVNNKRLTLQEKLNEIKQLSIEMKVKLMKNEKIIRDIKKITVELNYWQKNQLELIENDNYEMLYHFKQRKQILETELGRQNINLENVQKITESEKDDGEILEKSLNNLQLIKSRLTQVMVQTQNEIEREDDNNSSVIKDDEPSLQNNNSTINITHIKKEELFI